MKSMLVASGNEEAVKTIHAHFSARYRIHSAASREACFQQSVKGPFEFILIDISFLEPGGQQNGYSGYRAALQPFWQSFPAAQVLVMVPQEMIREAVMAVKAGASNYITYPLNSEELAYVLESLLESLRIQGELDYLRDHFWRSDSLDLVRTNSPAMREVFEKVRSVAKVEISVLLTGETGTGKGVVARLIHAHSPRSSNQFISIHCGAIPDPLLESELFGHERGAFTGAVRRKLGKFEIASGGTIFLDEIGTISSSMQVKLLQVLQDKTFQRLGGEEVLEADVRIIAATNEDLKTRCEEGTFRRDLFYRLNVFPILLPPLHNRKEDIPLLVDFFLKRFNSLYPKQIQGVHPQVMEAFEQYGWPGNIRELENLIERAHILEESTMLRPESFPREIFSGAPPWQVVTPDNPLTLAEVRRQSADLAERHYLGELLTLNRGSIQATARDAGISVRQVHKLMTRLGLHKEDFKPPRDLR